MLLSTCPQCSAQFKVAPEQLNVRQGRVMCGRCRNVFNAFESLKRVADEEPVEISDYALVDSTHQTASDASQTTQTAPDEPILFSSHEPNVPAELVASAIDVHHQDDTTTASRHTPEFVTVTTTASVDTLFDGKIDPAFAPTKLSVPAATSDVAPDVSDNPLLTGRVPKSRRPSRAWTWLAGLAALLLIVQALYFFRSVIVQQYPQLRPHFVAACDFLQCQIAWGRNQDAIKIESSDLIEPPGKQGRILLSATLVNRAATKHDFPMLEVKLMDASNAVLSSRIFSPQEYLGRVPNPEEGITPNAELYINLNLALASKSSASGYGLRAFYP
jgi:predicted Zn finger-like uncharacterized protein